MTREEELKAMAYRVLVRRIAGDIRQHAKKIADDPENLGGLLPQLKIYVRALEDARGHK
jgi:hypothetical protein